MASRSTPAERRAAEAEHNALPTQQMAAFTESAASLYRGVEAVQQVHQHAAQRSALRMQQAADRLRNSENATDLMSIQSMMLLGGVQEWAQYYQDMALAMLRVQAQMSHAQEVERTTARAVESGVEATSTRAMDAASAAADATSAATVAVLKSWSSMMGGGLSAGDSRAAH